MSVNQRQAARPLRVCILGLRAVVGAQGGIEAHVRDVAAGLMQSYPDELRVEVLERTPYVDAGRALPEWARRLRLTSLWSPRSTGLEAIVHTFLGVLRAGVLRPDLVHIHGIGPALMTPLARLLGLRVVVTHHGQDYAREKWGRFARTMLRLGELSAARFAHERIVIAPGLDQTLWEMYARRFRYIPNAAPLFKRTTSQALLGQLGLQPGRYVMHVGRIVPEKRQLDLIEAFRRAGDGGWQLVLVGGNDHPSPYEQDVKKLAANTPGVVMTGVLRPEQITELLSHTGLFALPSSHEGLPISLLEAMMVGAPVLVSRLPSLVALDLPPTCYVDVGAVDELARQLVVSMREGGSAPPVPVDWQRWLRPFTIESVAEQTLATYRQASSRAQALPST